MLLGSLQPSLSRGLGGTAGRLEGEGMLLGDRPLQEALNHLPSRASCLKAARRLSQSAGALSGLQGTGTHPTPPAPHTRIHMRALGSTGGGDEMHVCT